MKREMQARSCLINADLGEGGLADESLFALVDVANIACGGHTGDETSMTLAIERALENGVQGGAHPSYEDKLGFGRKRPVGPMSALYSVLCTQIETFENLANRLGLKTRHFKPHGQLYNDAAFNAEVAGLLIRVAHEFPHLEVYCLAASPLVGWANDEGVSVVEEGFPDRGYLSDGRLVPRNIPGAVLDNPQAVGRQAMALATGQSFESVDGGFVSLAVTTLCVHGDNQNALLNAQAVAQALRLG